MCKRGENETKMCVCNEWIGLSSEREKYYCIKGRRMEKWFSEQNIET
jgi:hypothetical protein